MWPVGQCGLPISELWVGAGYLHQLEANVGEVERLGGILEINYSIHGWLIFSFFLVPPKITLFGVIDSVIGAGFVDSPTRPPFLDRWSGRTQCNFHKLASVGQRDRGVFCYLIVGIWCMEVARVHVPVPGG